MGQRLKHLRGEKNWEKCGAVSQWRGRQWRGSRMGFVGTIEELKRKKASPHNQKKTRKKTVQPHGLVDRFRFKGDKIKNTVKMDTHTAHICS